MEWDPAIINLFNAQANDLTEELDPKLISVTVWCPTCFIRMCVPKSSTGLGDVRTSFSGSFIEVDMGHMAENRCLGAIPGTEI